MKFPRFLQIAALILLAAGSQPALGALWQWSTSASVNGSADPAINFQEGQSPSSLNDSARALMAVIAINNKDTTGQITSGGTISALTLTTNTGFPNLTALTGQSIVFVAGTSNAASATLNIDGTGAVNLADGNGVVPANELLAGGIYRVTYVSGAYRLHSVYGNPYNIPLGAMLPYTGTTVPNGNFIFPAAQCLSTTTYAAYWTLLGSPASGSCPGGQFRIIDMSGRVPAGLDTMPGFAAANRLTNSATGCGTAMTSVGAVCANGIEGSTIPLAQLPSITSSVTQSITVAPAGGRYIATATVALNDSSVNAGGASTALPLSIGGTWGGSPQSLSGSNTITVTSSGTSGSARPNVMPVIGVTYILRVL